MIFKIFLLALILILGIFLRLYQINNIPPGLNHDEAVIGYNAYSLLKTGADRYGENWPLTFRSFGSYILPVYTYLTIIPVAILGPTIASARMISAFSSILLMLITALLVFKIKEITFRGKLLAMLFISISPWAVFFGRGGYEISLAVTLFALSIFLFIKSLSNPRLIILTLVIAGISGSTYYTERYLGLIIFPLLIFIFKDKFLKYKRSLLIGIILLLIFQLPNLILIHSEAFTRRIAQVNYWNDQSAAYVLREFTTHYLEYFSPRSLFFEADPQGARSTPNLSVFYTWMIIPLWYGVKFLIKNRADPTFKILLLTLIVSPIPAALTKDPFYSTRVLSFLWILTIIISFGFEKLIRSIPKQIGIILVLALTSISTISLYSSYFVLLKYERAGIYGYEFRVLVNKLKEYPDRRIVMDNSRLIGANIWIPFYGKIDPLKYQAQTSDKIKNNYYNNTGLDTETKLDNFEIRPIVWKNDIYEDKILIGDALAISNEQVKEHKLDPLFEIKGLDGKVKLIAYTTNPKEKCGVGLKKGSDNPKCGAFSP